MKHDELLSRVALNLNMRHSTEAHVLVDNGYQMLQAASAMEMGTLQVGPHTAQFFCSM